MPRDTDHMTPDLPLGPNDTTVVPVLAPPDGQSHPSQLLAVYALMVVVSYFGCAAVILEQTPGVRYVLGFGLILFGLTDIRYLWMAVIASLGLLYLPFGSLVLHVVLSFVMLIAMARYLRTHYVAYACVEADPVAVQTTRDLLNDKQRYAGAPMPHWRVQVRAAWDAFHSWMTYPDPSHRGHWESPCGARATRQFVVGMVALLSGRVFFGPVHRLLVAFEDPGDIYRFALTSSFNIAWLITALLGPVVLFAGMSWWCRKDLSIVYVSLRAGPSTPTSRFHRDLAILHAHSRKVPMIRFGRHATTNELIAEPLQVLAEHALITGRTGGGKSTSLIQLLEQCVQLRTAQGKQAQVPSIIVMDLKGDSGELLGVLQRSGYPAKRVSIREERSSHMCNPFQMLDFGRLSADQRAQAVLNGLGTELKDEYGKQYFGAHQYVPLRDAFRKLHDFSSLNDLKNTLKEMLANKKSGLSTATRQNGELTLLLLEDLATIEPLQATRQNQPLAVYENRVDFGRFFREPSYLYMDLSSLLNPKSGPMFGRLCATTLAQIGTTLAPGERAHPVWLIIDEFQAMANSTFSRLIAMARSVNVSLILATQTLDVLQGRDWDLRKVLEENVGVKRFFTCNSPDQIDALQSACGECLDYEVSLTQTQDGVTRTYRSVRRPRFSQNELLMMSANPHHSILQINGRYSGAPILVESEYTMTKSEYEKLRCAPWPGKDDTTVRPIDSSPPPAVTLTPTKPPRPKPKQKYETRLGSLEQKPKRKKSRSRKKAAP